MCVTGGGMENVIKLQISGNTENTTEMQFPQCKRQNFYP